MIEIYPLLILICAFLIFWGPSIVRLNSRKQQRRKFRLIADKVSLLYQDINPYQLSMRARNDIGTKDKNLVYGEVEVLTLLYLISDLKLPQETIFYDLGSGCGKQVIAAHLAFTFKKSIGVECLPSLHAASLIVSQKIDSNEHIEFINDDFFNIDFSNAGCILVNATCLELALWQKLIKKLFTVKSGCYIIVITKRIDMLEQFKLLSENMELMSWGYATTRIYQKI